jgi:hypothetical protein
MLCRIGVLALAIGVLISPASAADRQVTITDQEYAAWAQVPTIMDRCIGAAVLKRDFGICQELAPFLESFAAKIANAPAAQPAPPPPAAQPSPPANPAAPGSQ